MTPPKPLAALSSSLLARKGAARPAMPSEYPADAKLADEFTPDRPIPSVLIEREALKSGIEQPARAPTSVSLARATRIGREAARKTNGTKAAFTLRLDADRHLRLRLASAATKCSSQQLVIQALDAFLQRLPEVEALVAQLPQAKPRKR